MNQFNEILLKRERRELQYKLAKLSYLAERKVEVEKETRTVMKILNFISNNHIVAEYNYLLSQRDSIEERIYEINKELG